ncbi:MAG: hypothetical protein QM715_01395 [Nibricoccus sp.]
MNPAMFFRGQLFATLAFALCLAISSVAQTSVGPLNGRIEKNQYISPTGAFQINIPVIAALGGSVTDTENVVIFQDRLNTHQSLACFKQDSTQRFEEESRGRKEYLIWFLANFVQADFEQRFHGARVESAHFIPDLQGGALLVYNLLPGGSMFANRALIVRRDQPPVAKRGNLLFVNHGHIYVLSIELAEKVIQGSAYTLTTEEEDAQLRKRLTDFLAKITFNPLPTADGATPGTAATPEKSAITPATDKPSR